MERDGFSWTLPLSPKRRPRHRRMPSNSSDTSHASDASHASHSSEDQFAFSPGGTPSKENAPSLSRYAKGHTTAKDGLLFGKEVTVPARASEDISASADSRSKPIKIEVPGDRTNHSTSVSASHPPEPLSARGDIAGGYFPLHEDPRSRVRAPHPFHLDADMARKQSLQRAAEASKSRPERPSLSAAKAPEAPPLPLPSQPSVSAFLETPISSYLPSGLHDDVALPLGKYYPSNWERRHGKSKPTRPMPPGKPIPAAVQSEPQVPTYRGDQGHARSGSEAQRRLQQYQRDMVAQAAMAASAILSKSASTSGSALPPSHVRVPMAFFKLHRPVSPRLRPVGSPGPVTPMSLEDDYMSLAFTTSAAGSDVRAAGDEDSANTNVARERMLQRKDSHALAMGVNALSV